MRCSNRKGFTLIELIIVVIIIGILAAIAAPMMAANAKKAKTSEAVAALGTLRTCARLYYMENSMYPSGITQIVGDAGYVKDADLDGRYYNHSNYTMSKSRIYANPIAVGEGATVYIDVITGNLVETP